MLGIYLCLLVSILIVVVITPDANAISREDEKIQKDIIKNAEKRILDIDVLVSEQKITIANNENSIALAKETLREIKDKLNTSWDAVMNVDTAERELKNYEAALTASNERYLLLLTERSDQTKIINKAKEMLQIPSQPFDIGKLDRKIGVLLSNNLITMIKNNMSSPNYPTYQELWSLDSSNVNVSGRFEIDHRAEPALKDSWRWYDNDMQLRIFVDPPKGMAERIRTITIQPNFDTYLVKSQMTVTQNSTYGIVNGSISKITGQTGTVLFHDVYVDEKCKQSTINASKWKSLLPLMIDYMRNGCDDSRLLEPFKEIITGNFTEQDITHTQKYKDEQYLDYIKNNCLKKYGMCGEPDMTKNKNRNES